MLDFDASKLLIIGVVALVVIGPKDLPRVLRQVGQAVTRLRRIAADFQGQFMDAMKEADLQDLQKEVSKLKDSATLDVKFDPVADVRQELSGALEVPAVATPAIGPLVETPHTRTVDAGALEAGSTADALASAVPAVETGSHPAEPPAEEAPAPGDAAPAVLEAPNEAENAAFRTTAENAGGIGAPAPPDPSRRRKIVVPKRRGPGDRLAVPRAGAAVSARSRLILPPRRDDPRT